MAVRNDRRVLAAVLAVVTVCLVGCTTHASIADINRDPGRFAGKDVIISGEASNVFSAFGKGVFQVDDGTGSIMVYSENFGLPGNAAKVSVTGQVEQGFSFGGRSFGVILRQTKALD